jgi:hypothetical protein
MLGLQRPIVNAGEGDCPVQSTVASISPWRRSTGARRFLYSETIIGLTLVYYGQHATLEPGLAEEE